MVCLWICKKPFRAPAMVSTGGSVLTLQESTPSAVPHKLAPPEVGRGLLSPTQMPQRPGRQQKWKREWIHASGRRRSGGNQTVCPSHREQLLQLQLVLTTGEETQGCQNFDLVMVYTAVLLRVKDVEIHVFIIIFFNFKSRLICFSLFNLKEFSSFSTKTIEDCEARVQPACFFILAYYFEQLKIFRKVARMVQ